jgi:predicted secreted Zn-dependent protease
MPTNYTGPVRHTYTIEGTLADVVATLEAQKEAGETTWPCDLTASQADDGTISSATIDCTINITMPVWSGYASAPAADRAEWDRFYAALEAHEQGHVEIVHAWLDNAAYAWFEGKAFDDRQSIMDSLMANVQYQSDAYDASNGHGINEGCTITVTTPAPESEAPAEESEAEQ